MTKVLDVYLNQKIIGELIQNQHGQIKFTYSSAWLNDSDAIAICRNLV